MSQLRLVLGNSRQPLQECRLDFEINSTSIAQKWFRMLSDTILNQSCLREPHRVYHFRALEEEKKTASSHIQGCLDILRENQIQLDGMDQLTDFDQVVLNRLHLLFEQLRGSIVKPSDLFLKASSEVRQVIERLNVEIHRMEDLIHENSTAEKRIVCTFQNRSRQLLADEDFSQFTLVRTFGQVYINYCEVGKTIYEVFRSNDHFVTEENIRPQRYFSADFNVWLGKTERSYQQAEEIQNKMRAWWPTHDFIAKRFEFNQPINAIGKIPVARLRAIEGNLNQEFDLQKSVSIQNEKGVEFFSTPSNSDLF